MIVIEMAELVKYDFDALCPTSDQIFKVSDCRVNCSIDVGFIIEANLQEKSILQHLFYF